MVFTQLSMAVEIMQIFLNLSFTDFLFFEFLPPSQSFLLITCSQTFDSAAKEMYTQIWTVFITSFYFFQNHHCTPKREKRRNYQKAKTLILFIWNADLEMQGLQV